MSVIGGKDLSKIERNVEDLIKPIITNLGYKLYDVIYEKEAKDYYLRIFIDKETGISLYIKNENEEGKNQYEANSVNDIDVQKPDISEYTKQ